MRRQGLCDSSFESSDHADSKNIKDKLRRPRGGTLEHFETLPRKWRISLSSDTTVSRSKNKSNFHGSVSSKLQNKVSVDSIYSRLRTFQFLEFDLVGEFAGVGGFRALSVKSRDEVSQSPQILQFWRFWAKKNWKKVKGFFAVTGARFESYGKFPDIW